MLCPARTILLQAKAKELGSPAGFGTLPGGGGLDVRLLDTALGANHNSQPALGGQVPRLLGERLAPSLVRICRLDD